MRFSQSGFWSGILATSPMTFLMFAMQQESPRGERSPLPPATLTADALQKTGLQRRISPQVQQGLSMASHFAFGGFCGTIYGMLSPRINAPSVLKGLVFGLGVWGASYLGWIPALGWRAAAVRMPLKRTGWMVLAHGVWGVALGLSARHLQVHAAEDLDGRRHTPDGE